jgi:hypothetical protein
VTATTPDGATHAVTVRVDPRSPLVERYAPILHFAADEEYFPTRYEAFFHRSTLVRHGDWGSRTVLARNPSVFDLADRDERTAVRLQGTPEDYRTYADPYDYTVYASVHDDVRYDGASYTAITYWLFYVFDPKVEPYSKYAAHQSDIESVTILVDESGPQWVGASQHYGGETIEWAKAPHSGTHLHVYPALGAHSNYLVNTDEYDGSGIFAQVQHVLAPTGPGAGSSSFSPAYRDTTGDSVVLRHDADDSAHGVDGSHTYEIVPLLGTERWATFRGGVEGEPGKGTIPMQQARWGDPGRWMTDLVPDEHQVTIVAEVLSLDLSPAGLTGTIEFQNRGPKPRTVWVVFDAKPTGSRWASESTVRIVERSVALGTGTVANVSYSGDYPRAGADAWDLRVRVLGYAPTTAEPEDRYFAYRTEYPAAVPPDGLDLAAGAPTTHSWHLPIFVTKYAAGAPIVPLVIGGLLSIALVRIVVRSRRTGG